MFSLLQLILSLPQVEACAVVLHESSPLLAFVVASTSGDQRPALTSAERSASAEHRGDLLSPVKQRQEEPGGADGDLSRLILNQLSLLLPSYSVPDTLLLVPALCLTPHGEHHTHSYHPGETIMHLCLSFCLFYGRQSRHKGTCENIPKTETMFGVFTGRCQQTKADSAVLVAGTVSPLLLTTHLNTSWFQI